MKKRKPWRNFRKHSEAKRRIRYACLFFLIIEFIILTRTCHLSIPTIEVKENNEVIIYQLPADGVPSSCGLSEQSGDGKIYGIRIRLKEGVIDFYRQEHMKQYPKSEQDK